MGRSTSRSAEAEISPASPTSLVITSTFAAMMSRQCSKCKKTFIRNAITCSSEFEDEKIVRKEPHVENAVMKVAETGAEAVAVVGATPVAIRVGRAGLKAAENGQNAKEAMAKACTRGWKPGFNSSHKAAERVESGAGKVAKCAVVGIGVCKFAKAAKNGNGRESAKAITGTASGLLGAEGGAAFGAFVGSCAGPVGTGVGGFIGGFIGGFFGQAAGEHITDAVADLCSAEELCDDCNAWFQQDHSD